MPSVAVLLATSVASAAPVTAQEIRDLLPLTGFERMGGDCVDRAVGADRVELYTEPYAAAWHTPERAAQLERFRAAAQAALDAGLGVNAGHDLNRDNLTAFLRAVPGVSEVSIGHALIADALELGYAATIAEYNRCIHEAFA